VPKISTDVFISADSMLRFLRLHEANISRTKRKPGMTKPGKSRDLLEQFGKCALQHTTAPAFRALILKEIYVAPGHKPVRATALPRIVQSAGESLDGAKKFAKLLLRATFFHLRNQLAGEKEETPHHFAALCFLGAALEFINVIPQRPELYRNSYAFVHQLVSGVRRGDEESERLLRLLFLESFQFGYMLSPLPQSQFSLDHLNIVLTSISTEVVRQGSNLLPFPCLDSDHEILSKVFRSEIENRNRESRTLGKQLERFNSIPISAYEDFLSTRWELIASNHEPHLVLTGGNDKVEINIPAFESASLHSFSFVREDPPDSSSSFCRYPKIHVMFFWDCLGEKDVTTATITEEGEILGFRKDSWPPVLSKLLWTIVLDAYAHIVLPKAKDAESAPKQGRGSEHKRERRRRRPGEKVFVHPHFRKLAAGWRASEEQIAKAIEYTGEAPPPGKTFVDEFDRGFPGERLPKAKTGNLWDRHQQILPVLSYDEDVLEEVLSEVLSFAPQ